MSLIHQSSPESIDTGLDLFTVPPTQTSIENGFYVEYSPLAALNPSSNIEFQINNKAGVEYIDLANTFLSIKARVTHSDGKTLEAQDRIVPTNLWLHSLFSQVDLLLNGVLVTPSENTYPYKAYLETLLSYDKQTTDSQLKCSMFTHEDGGKLDTIATSEGMLARGRAIATSKTVSMFGRLHTDIMKTNRFLLNGVDVVLRLVKSKDAFNLISVVRQNVEYKTEITSAVLFVRKCKLNPSILVEHQKILSSGLTAKYPLKRVSVKSFSVPTGSLTSTHDNLFLSQLPKRIIVGLVDSDAYNGHFNKNPFNFKHMNLSYLGLNIDGENKPSSPLTPDFEAGVFTRPFYRLFTDLGLACKNESLSFGLDDFDKGYALYAFDLSPSILDGNQIELIRSGNLRLELKFAKALTAPIHVIVYGELDSIIEINNSRQVLTDFTY